jgi:uncharacterized protein
MHCETLSKERPIETGEDLSKAARARLLSARGEPLFVADWRRAVFIHYEVSAEELQADVPFELDLHEGKAYVTLVAFTMRGMRPMRGGPLAAWLLKPIATNDYLNVRAYVRHRGEPGIYFLTEWMNNRFSIHLGAWPFGLPYRFGFLSYRHEHEIGVLSGTIQETVHGDSFNYEATLADSSFVPCPAGSFDEFLLERYTAFTCHNGKRRYFRIWHRPWLQQPLRVSARANQLIARVWPWFSDAMPVAGNYSPGARDVWMGRPHRVSQSGFI